MSGVASIAGRIAGIEARFAPLSPAATSLTASVPADFDPFGEEYQKAVAAVQANTGPVSAQPAGTAGVSTGVVSNAALMVGSPATAGSPGSAVAGVASGSAATFGQNAAAIAGVAAAPGRHAVGGYGPMPVPAELAGTGNGRISRDVLFPIGDRNHRLAGPAAASWRNLVSAAATDGIDLKITDSYRSYDQQVDLVRRKGLYADGGLAATPGTSNHGWGLAVDADVTDPATRDWLQINGPRFGWVEAVPREPWHWEFRPNQV